MFLGNSLTFHSLQNEWNFSHFLQLYQHKKWFANAALSPGLLGYCAFFCCYVPCACTIAVILSDTIANVSQIRSTVASYEEWIKNREIFWMKNKWQSLILVGLEGALRLKRRYDPKMSLRTTFASIQPFSL